MGKSFRRTDFWDSSGGQVLRLFKGIPRHSLINHCLHTSSCIFYVILQHTAIPSKQDKVTPTPYSMLLQSKDQPYDSGVTLDKIGSEVGGKASFIWRPFTFLSG